MDKNKPLDEKLMVALAGIQPYLIDTVASNLFNPVAMVCCKNKCGSACFNKMN